MTRRSQVVLTLVAGLLLALGAGVLSAQGTSRAPAPCGAGGPGTVYDDHEVRVFTREVSEANERIVACSHISGHRTKLGQDNFDLYAENIDHISAPGRWLGYAILRGYKEGSAARACALRIRDGKRRCNDAQAVFGLGATRAGSVAWMTYRGSFISDYPECCAVYKRDAGSEDAVLLDQGPDIDGNSFAVGGRHIYWMNAGEPKSATMP